MEHPLFCPSNAVKYAGAREQRREQWAINEGYNQSRCSLPDGPWERATLGRNVVCLSPTLAVKLGPPCWSGDIAREADALGHVAGRLLVHTPTVLARGALEGWEYLVTAHCSGVNLHTLWNQLDSQARLSLAQQHGALMAAVQALGVEQLPSSLAFDWEQMLTEQRRELEQALARSGLHPQLVAQAAAYLDEAAALSEGVDATVLVHGDLTHLNLLVEQREAGWTITSLLDWGDVKLGSWTHELISPAVHMYRGHGDALGVWYHGYGRLPRAATVAHLATARAVLYYADEFAAILQRLPGGMASRDWPAVARCLWRLDEQ